MEPNAEGNLLEIIDLARTLRQEQLFIQQEQAAFAQLSDTLVQNSTTITKLAYICAQQRQNLSELLASRPETGAIVCCQRANNYDNAKFVDSKKVMNYEHAIAYENLFSCLYNAPYLLALSLATGDRLPEVSTQHLNCIINTISTGLYGNAINTKDVEMMLKLLRELFEIQIVGSEQPRRLLRTNSSAFARLYQRLNESMFSAKIFLTAALYTPLMGVLSSWSESVLDLDPQKFVNNLPAKERLQRFGVEETLAFDENVMKFHAESIGKLYQLVKSFIDSFAQNWSLFPSTLRWLVQTMCHQLKQAHYADDVINDVIADMVFTHFICPAIVNPDLIGIIDVPITEQVRFNLMQIGQIIQMLAVTRDESDVEPKYAALYAKFECNLVTNLIDLLLVGQTVGEDVVAILSQQSDFERAHLVSTERELSYFTEFFRILCAHDEYDISAEERQKLKKILAQLPVPPTTTQPEVTTAVTDSPNAKKKESSFSLSKVTKNKLAKSMSFNINGNGSGNSATEHSTSAPAVTTISVALANGSSSSGSNGTNQIINGNHLSTEQINEHTPCTSNANSTSSSPTRNIGRTHGPSTDNIAALNIENEPILLFTIYSAEKNKLQPLTEEEVLKMNSIGPDIANGDVLLVDTADSCNMEHTIDKSSEANGYDGIDGMSDVLRPLHGKTTRFSLSQDDASIGNSDNLEVVSEAPSNHSVTSSLELEEEHDQNDNLSDMVSANVSGRGTPNISGRDTPSSQVTDGGSIHNAIPTPQMQKLLSKARSDIEDKFCKFEIKKFEGDENVSIISDTWSTDVLASDSETLDANDRERDRNFSTPLIPSAVVLPGDNNFVDALASARGAVRVGGGYLDASDQRSESNWSTDVLASDSEKFAEVDTDDNVSITAKSDITDAGARSETERDMLVEAISAHGIRNVRNGTLTNRSGVGSSGLCNGNGINGRNGETVDGAGIPAEEGTHGSSGGDNVSDRSQEDSTFFDAVNMYDEATKNVARSYQGPSSLARSSVRTTNQMSGENSFQQNYKSGYEDEGEKAPFLATPRMRRQTSAESSISNQSLNLEESGKPPPPKSHHKSAMKKKKHSSGCGSIHMIAKISNSECRDLIDFSDCSEDKPTTSSGLLHRKMGGDIFARIDEMSVEHRRISMEQRNAGEDGRRNGIMALKGGETGSSSHLTPSLRRHQSLNYENHEIMLNANVPKRVSAAPGGLSATATTTTTTIRTTTTTMTLTAQTDDDKQQELLSLCAKANQLKLNENNGSDAVGNTAAASDAAAAETSGVAFNANISTLHKLATVVNTPMATATSAVSITDKKSTKSTGAIPKSISFDASADKNIGSSAPTGANNASGSTTRTHTTHRSQRSMHDSSAGGTQSGIFNKLKQNIFGNRRGKSLRHSGALSNTTNDCDDFGTTPPYSQTSRSVSFNPQSSEVSVDFIAGCGSNRIGAGLTTAGTFSDITEDILAKYRRKVSTSSEATNSDSIGNGVAAGGGGLLNTATTAANRNNNCAIADGKLAANATLLDKALSFNVVKRKIRTVLSKTDLHSGDFRQTTHINASPLQTYLQIQLAQAINLQNFQQITYVSEAIRCIATLEPKQHRQLLEELQHDIQKRQNYLQYLMRYRQNLLLIMENTEQFETRLRSESSSSNRYLMHVCIRLYLERCQTKIETFQEEFARLTLSDDKIELIEEFIESLMRELQSTGGLLHNMPEWQATEARNSMEHILLQRIYQQVMFPNEDADLSRDIVLSEHISKLQRIICPSHPALCIPQEYLTEAPWTFAQQQLRYISAYKTPREKLDCVIRCISSIMSLLQMSSGRIPAADDLLPVLIYVVIMANPPYLLSTIDYITCFIGEKLDGESQFHWTLFGSVVKFIKTMDYFD